MKNAVDHIAKLKEFLKSEVEYFATLEGEDGPTGTTAAKAELLDMLKDPHCSHCIIDAIKGEGYSLKEAIRKREAMPF